MMSLELSIGEFSKATGLTVKTLRFYHEQGVLRPSSIDDRSGYRYYRPEKIEVARVISRLRELGFPLRDIAEIIESHDEESDIIEYLEQRRSAIQQKVDALQDAAALIDQIVSSERETRTMVKSLTFEIEEKQVEPLLIAGIRMQGRYEDCGKAFSKIGRRYGRHIGGKAMMLHFSTEYREDDADFEACFPIRKNTGEFDGIAVRDLPGGRFLTLVHRGPYQELSRSYERAIRAMKQRGYPIHAPCREVYLKGPGMIFKGNPRKYLTEIQFRIDQAE
jgi:DNA-binding transcriptional MerR regulator